MKWASAVSMVLLFGAASQAQTSWISATFDGQVASWIFSITPSSTPVATAASTTPSTTLASTSALSSSPSSRTSQTSSSPTSSGTSSSSNSSSRTRDSTLVTSISRSPTSTSATAITTSSSSISSSSTITPSSFATSSAAGITLSQAAASIPSSSSTVDSSSTTSNVSNSSTLLKIILSVVISILAVLVLAIVLFLCLRRRRRNAALESQLNPMPHDQEKNWQETAYLPFSQPTLPNLRNPHASMSQIYIPAPIAAAEMRQTRQDSLYEPSPLEQPNPFLGSAERLSAFSLPGSARGAYQPLAAGRTQQASSPSHSRALGGAMIELPAGAHDRPLMPHNVSSNEASTDYTDSRPSSDGYKHGDLGLLTHHDHYEDIPPPQSGETRYPAAARPLSGTTNVSPYSPSVLANPATPYRNVKRSPVFEEQGFDFGFGRLDSGKAGPVTGYRKSPNTSIYEKVPMVSADSGEVDEGPDEAGTGGMVPLGYSPDTIPTHTGGGRGSIRRESLNDRLGSLRRAASVRRSSLRGGRDKSGSPSGRFSIPRRPIGTP